MVRHKRFIFISILMMIMATPVFVQAQSILLSTFTNVGLGQVIVEADQIVVSVGIENFSNTAEHVHTLNQSIVQEIKENLLKLGLDKLEFVHKKVNIWQQRSSISKEVTYRATSGLDIIFYDESVVGKVVDIAMLLGATSIQGVKFQASDLSNAKQKALDLAVADAIKKANIISQATGMRIVGIRSVIDNNIVRIINPGDAVLVEAGYLPQASSQIAVQRGEVLVEVEVIIEFETTMSANSE